MIICPWKYLNSYLEPPFCTQVQFCIRFELNMKSIGIILVHWLGPYIVLEYGFEGLVDLSLISMR